MSISLGLDVGSVSVKLVALGAPEDYPVLAHVAQASSSFFLPRLPKSNGLSDRPMVFSIYRRLQGNPLQAASDLLREFCNCVSKESIRAFRSRGQVDERWPAPWTPDLKMSF